MRKTGGRIRPKLQFSGRDREAYPRRRPTNAQLRHSHIFPRQSPKSPLILARCSRHDANDTAATEREFCLPQSSHNLNKIESDISKTFRTFILAITLPQQRAQESGRASERRAFHEQSDGRFMVVVFGPASIERVSSHATRRWGEEESWRGRWQPSREEYRVSIPVEKLIKTSI